MDTMKCPECGREIGKYVLTSSMTVKGIGSVPVFDSKPDYRKAAHIGFGKGLICKRCAKQFFPDGLAYRVTVNYHGKRIAPFIGIKQTGLFPTAGKLIKPPLT